MKKAENKTKPTSIKPNEYIKSLPSERQKEARELIKLFEKATNKPCVMWGEIFGFGTYVYVSEKTGRSGDWMATGFAFRKSGIAIYTFIGHKNYPEILSRLGVFKDAGQSCIHVKKLADVNTVVLQQLIKNSLKDLVKKYIVK